MGGASPALGKLSQRVHNHLLHGPEPRMPCPAPFQVIWDLRKPSNAAQDKEVEAHTGGWGGGVGVRVTSVSQRLEQTL